MLSLFTHRVWLHPKSSIFIFPFTSLSLFTEVGWIQGPGFNMKIGCSLVSSWNSEQNFWLRGSLSQKTARPAWFRTKGSWGLPGGLDLLVVVFDFGGSGPKPHWTITDLCICCASYVRYLPQKGGREDLAGLGGMEVILGSRSSTGTPLLIGPKSFLFPNKYWQEYW